MVPPRTMRSGCSVSCTALPSRRNSGFQTSSARTPAGAVLATTSRSQAPVPTGTVDLPTMSASCVRCRAIEVVAASTKRRSAAWLVFDCGVPTQTKCTSAQPTASATSVVNRRRPVASCSVSSSGSPGS